ncbi:hypothetical protein [Humibacter sp.]|uniref:hypothetical protein n=1 Tax=Humibacter sp. TaxID=1940291 RepID=UPI003F81A89B
MKPWLTYTEAAKITRRSKRTLRRWVSEHLVRTDEADDGTPLLATADVLAVEKTKTEYRQKPFTTRRAS